MKSIQLLFLVLICFVSQLPAQTKKTSKNYQLAREYLDGKKYSMAADLFEEVLRSGEDNNLTRFSQFFLAFIAKKENQMGRAKQYYQTLLEKYPNWENKDEVYYNLADIAFQENEPELGFNYLNKIQDPKFRNDRYHLGGHYLSSMDLLKLRLLQQTFPKDTLIAQALVDKIAATSDDPDNFLFMMELVESLDVQLPARRKVAQIRYSRKPYKVAILLPFDYERLKARDTTNLSKIAMHLYQGMRLARKELDSLDNISLQFYAYDIGRRDLDKLNSLIYSEEFSDIDLMVGPIFDPLFRKLSEFAGTQKINLISPLSTEEDLLNSEFTYLFYPSLKTQARQMVDFMASRFSSKGIIVFSDNLPRNEEFKKHFQEYLNEKYAPPLASVSISTSALNSISETINRYSNDEIKGMLISSTSQLAALELLKVLGRKQLNVPILAPKAWLDNQSIDSDELERYNFYFYYPDYLDKELPAVSKFEEKYLKFAFRKPSEYAFVGYQMMHYFAYQLVENGSNTSFQVNADIAPNRKNTFTFWNLKYENRQDNQSVPVLKLVNGDIQLVNPR